MIRVKSKPKFCQGMLVTAYNDVLKVIISGFDLSAGMWKYAVENSKGLTSKINEMKLRYL